MEKAIWTEKFKIESYQTNANGVASLSSVCNFLQTAAGNHAESRGFGYKDMIRKEMIWVLSRLKVRMYKYPKWFENIEIETWLRQTDGVFAQRDFIIRNEKGEKLGVALSGWVAINTRTRRPQKQEDHVNSIPALNDKHAYDGTLEKIPLLNFSANKDINFRNVVFSDLDVNYHVNNVKYIEWITNSYPIDFLKKNAVKQLEINYLKETLPTDNIAILTEKKENISLHAILREKDKKNVAAIRIEW